MESEILLQAAIDVGPIAAHTSSDFYCQEKSRRVRFGLRFLLILTSFLLLRVESDCAMLERIEASITPVHGHHSELGIEAAPFSQAEEEESKREQSESLSLHVDPCESTGSGNVHVRFPDTLALNHGRCGNRAILTNQGRLQV